jgi:hypothetical protein
VPTERRIDDVAELAAILLAEFRQGTPLHKAVQDGSSVEDATVDRTTFRIDVVGEGRDLRGIIATLDTIQLAIDAAAVAVLYDRDIPEHTEVELLDYVLRSLASRPIVSLEILELRDGSFVCKVTAVFKEPLPRRITLSIATLGAATLAIILPPVGLPLTIVTAMSGAGEFVGAIQDHRAAKEAATVRTEQEKVIAELQKQAKADREREADLQRQIGRLDARLTALQSASWTLRPFGKPDPRTSRSMKCPPRHRRPALKCVRDSLITSSDAAHHIGDGSPCVGQVLSHASDRPGWTRSHVQTRPSAQRPGRLPMRGKRSLEPDEGSVVCGSARGLLLGGEELAGLF